MASISSAGPSRMVGIGLRPARLILLVLLVAAFAALMVLGRHLTFWQDEWSFIGPQPSGIAAWLIPHNEHWSTVPLLLYRGILGVVGLHTYLPYLGLLVAMHVVAVGGAFVLLARRLPPWAAVVGVAPLLLLGSGYENLFWAFQIGFVGSVAAGTWGLVAFDTDQRRWTAVVGVVLLIIGLASSGMGLFFVLAAGVRLVADPASRRRAIWIAIPAGVYVAWYLAYGRQGLSGPLAAPGHVAVFAARGLVYAVARITGFDLAGHASVLGWILAVAALALVIVVLVRGVLRRSVPPLAIAGLVAAAAMYVVIGLTRADLASDFATRSRYVYVAAFLLVPATGDLISHLHFEHRWPRAAVVGLLALAGLSIAANLVDLRAGRAQFTEDARLTRAYLTVIADHGQAGWMDPSGLPLGWPDFQQLRSILARYGSPVDDSVVPSDATKPRAADLDRATISLALKAFKIVSGPPPGSAGAVEPKVLQIVSATVVRANGCVAATPAPTGGSVTVAVPDGGGLTVTGAPTPVDVWLGRLKAPTSRFELTLPITGGGAGLEMPDLGDGSSWQVRLDLPTGTAHADICVFSSWTG